MAQLGEWAEPKSYWSDVTTWLRHVGSWNDDGMDDDVDAVLKICGLAEMPPLPPSTERYRPLQDFVDACNATMTNEQLHILVDAHNQPLVIKLPPAAFAELYSKITTR